MFRIDFSRSSPLIPGGRAIGDNRTMTPPAPENESRQAEAPQPGDYYYDGPYLVFTEAYHLRRGYCCRSGCRHCPYGFTQERSEDAPEPG